MPSLLARHVTVLADMIMWYNLKNEGTGKAFTPDQIEILANFCQAQSAKFNRENWYGYMAGVCSPSGGKNWEKIKRDYAREWQRKKREAVKK